MGKRGYADYTARIPPGWRVAPVERWPINNPGSDQPTDFKVENWRFRTHGEVENPLELTYQEFQKLPHISKILDHHCIDGWSFLGQSWNGVDISTIKDLTHVKSTAKYLLVEGGTCLSQRFPIEQALLLVDGQNGSKLTRSAGFPLRLIAPGEFGFKSKKWIDGIKFCATRDIDGLENSFMQDGIYDLYSERLCDFNPWTVDNSARKNFLRKLFAADTERARQGKKSEHLKAIKETDAGDNTTNESRLLCSLDAIAEKSSRRFVVNGSEVLLVKTADQIYAVEPICTHLGTDLSGGKLNGDAKTLKCPLHGAVFDVASGNCLNGSYGSDGDTFPNIRTYRIMVKENSVFLERKQDWGPVW